MAYLDDFLCIKPGAEECSNSVSETIILLLQWLGFVVNYKQADQFLQKCRFLGFTIDSENLVVRLPKKKSLVLLDLIKKCMENKEIKIVEVAPID